MFHKALLTLDRSEFADAAIPRVADITTEEAVVCEIVESVAHILGRGGPAFEIPADVAEQIRDSEHAAVQQHLDDVAQQLRDAGVAKVTTAIREGRPGPEIIELAQEEGCDVIVMSTHGRGGLMGAIIGSVANYVVQHARREAVLLVRPGE